MACTNVQLLASQNIYRIIAVQFTGTLLVRCSHTFASAYHTSHHSHDKAQGDRANVDEAVCHTLPEKITLTNAVE